MHDAAIPSGMLSSRGVRHALRLALVLSVLLVATGSASPVAGRANALPAACAELAFSVEQSFRTRGPTPPDNNPIISNGDLLGKGCIICARNADLLQQFDVTIDLGLDAADVIDAESYLVAFSTELASPNQGQFTEGDLLVTNGAIIPNRALTYGFGISYDVGLDGVHFIGPLRSILGFLTEAARIPRSSWLDPMDRLVGMLRQWEIDIWFSTEEGAQVPGAISFIDGDLLSARDGAIVARNSVLLPGSVPAGIPDRGIDFGLDAVSGPRLTGEQAPEGLRFSTELLNVLQPTFTDGDVLAYGNGIAIDHDDLVGCFEPASDFLGLDALSMPSITIKDLVYFQLILKNARSYR